MISIASGWVSELAVFRVIKGVDRGSTLSVVFPDRRGREKSTHAKAHWLGGRRGVRSLSSSTSDSREINDKGTDGQTDRRTRDAWRREKEKEKDPPGIGKENERERRSARVPTMSMTPKARTVISLLRLQLFLRLSFSVSSSLLSVAKVLFHALESRGFRRRSLSRSADLKRYRSIAISAQQSWLT